MRPPPGAQRLASAARSARLDRAADGGEALSVRVEDPARPVRRRARRRRRGARPRRRPRRRAAPPARRAPPSSARRAAATASRRAAIRGSTSTSSSSGVRADLREPGAELGDEVEREPVAARAAIGARTRELDLDLARPARRVRKRVADAVPDDRVAAVVEPVVRELHAARARAPRRRAGVLELDARDRGAPRRGAPSDRSRASGPRAGRRGSDARRRAPCRG